MKKVLCFVLSLMIFLHSLALDVSYAADFTIVPIIANYSVSDLNKNFANIDNDVFYYAVGGTVTAYAATRGYQLVKDKFADTKQAFVDIGRKMYDTVLELPGNTKGAFINLLGSLARFTRNTTNLTSWLADQIPVLWNAGKDVMQNIFNIFHSNEIFNDWQLIESDFWTPMDAPVSVVGFSNVNYLESYNNFFANTGSIYVSPPFYFSSLYWAQAYFDVSPWSNLAVLLVNSPGNYHEVYIVSSVDGHSLPTQLYGFRLGKYLTSSATFSAPASCWLTLEYHFTFDSCSTVADALNFIKNYRFLKFNTGEYYNAPMSLVNTIDFPIYVGLMGDTTTWTAIDASFDNFGFVTGDSDTITVAPADSVLDIKDFALDIEQAVPVAGVIADTVAIYTDNVYENEQSVAADIPVSATGSYESSIPTIELPTGQIIVPGGLFGKVNHYIKYLWEMTKPLVTYMSQILTALTWHDGGGPAWLFYGAIVVSIIGGMVYKFLQ